MKTGPSAPGRIGFWTAIGALFALAYSQAPLYTSNQNQYFLHGMAAAGYGHLAADWLANTLDPTPVFSWLVAGTFAWVGPWFFYIEYGLLHALTLWGLYAIAVWLLPEELPRERRLALLVILTLLFSEAVRFPLSHFTWADGGYLLEGGVAGQRLLGPVLEPSAFGGLLGVSIALFLRGRPHAAALMAAGVATVHPTYLLTSGGLVGAYAGVLAFSDHRRVTALASGGLALAGVVPILIHTLAIFGVGGSQVSADAARVLVDFRIPHHAIPAQWLDLSVAIKLGLVIGAMFVVRRTRVLPILAVPAALGLVLSLVQVARGSDRLALLFPWRVSVLLAPVSTVILASQAMAWGWRQLDRRKRQVPSWTSRAAWAAMIILALAGAASFALHLQRQSRDPETALFAQVRRSAAPGQVFLIPPGLQDFRLATGEPAFVDFKAIPYAPGEVLTWYDRIRLSQYFYRDNPADIDCNLLERAAAAGVTHVVLEPAQQGVTCEILHKVWGDDSFELDRLGP